MITMMCLVKYPMEVPEKHVREKLSEISLNGTKFCCILATIALQIPVSYFERCVSKVYHLNITDYSK